LKISHTIEGEFNLSSENDTTIVQSSLETEPYEKKKKRGWPKGKPRIKKAETLDS
jgi:hypothetical protein